MPVVLTNIAIGTVPGDGTGDTPRAAFEIINTNNDALGAAVLTQAEIDARIALLSASTGYIGTTLSSGSPSYTLVLTDAGKIINMAYAASPQTLNIPDNSVVAFPVNTRIDVYWATAAAAVGIAMAGTDTLYGNPNIGAEEDVVSLWKRAATEWVVIGGVA